MRLGTIVVALCAATACGRIGYEMIDENNQPIGTSSGSGGAGGALPPVTTGSAGLGGATSSATTAAGSTGVGTGSGGLGGATAGSTGVGAGGSATGGGAAGSTTGGAGAGGSATGAGGSATGAGGSATGSGGAGTTGVGGAGTGGSGSTSTTGGASGSGGAGGAGGAGGKGIGGSSGSSGAAGSADAGGSACLSGMSAAFNAHNYFFCSTQVTWDVARTDCHARGMFLVRIDDQAENDWVHSMIPAADQASNKTSLWRWMGGNMLVTIDDWKWDDGQSFWSGGKNGTPVNGLYSNWAPIEPVGTNNLCLSMMASIGTWYNMDCTGGRPYVCEQY
jgi:hypothetical protein